MISNQCQIQGNTRLLGITKRGGHTRVRNRCHQVRVNKAFPCQLAAKLFTVLIDTMAKYVAVRARKVNRLENTTGALHNWKTV